MLSQVLVGRDAAGAVSELLLPEHSPTYVDEYLRMMKACPDAGMRHPVPLHLDPSIERYSKASGHFSHAGIGLRFVYDCPDGELFDIFTTGILSKRACIDLPCIPMSQLQQRLLI